EDAPLGAQVLDGEFISSTPFLPGYYTFAMTKDKQLLLDELSFNGVVTAANGKTFSLHGVNKAIHWEDQQQHSHPDRMFMYTSAWGKARRANDGVTKPTEIIVQDGIVTKIQRWAFDMAPPEDGYIIRGDGKAAEFLQENVKVGEPFVVDYS